MLNELRVHDLGVLRQQRLDDRDADAAADVAHQAEDRGALGQHVSGQGREGDDAQRREHKPRPKPCNTPVTTTGAMPIYSEKPVICHIATAVTISPPRMISRVSMRLARRATRIIATIVPIPRGAVTRPVVTTG